MNDWGSALAILVAGVVVGLALIHFFTRKKADAAAPSSDLELRDLEAKRDALVAQLRDGVASDEERARIERETADVLRKIDGHVPPAAAAAATRPARRHPVRQESTIKGFLWGSGTTAALFALGIFVYTKTGVRPADQPMTGAMQPPPQQQQAPDPALQQLEAQVQQRPDDLALRHQLARAYLDREQLMGVFEQTRVILEKSPHDAQAQTYQAIVRMAMGQQPEAQQLLEAATKNDPQLTDAWVALAWLFTQQGKSEQATAAIAEAAKRHPEDATRLNEVLGQMRAQASRAAAAQPAAAPSGPSVQVTVNLDPSARPSPNAVLFLIARAAGQTAGPPIAVKRVAAGTWPLSLTLSQADSMMGQPLPNAIRLEARLDVDGDAMTKDPSEPKAAQDGVAVGGRVELVLK